jgi:hypothetical protein
LAKDFVRNILDQLFKKGPTSGDDLEALSGKLERSKKFELQFEKWKSEAANDDLQELSLAYDAVRQSVYRPGMHSFSSPQSNGFFFNPHLDIPSKHFHFLLDHFRDVLLNQGYRLYTSDQKYAEKPAGIKRTDRHYLKPDYTLQESTPLNQHYGNVLIELSLLDEKPEFLKLMANVYSDQNYQDPRPFKELVSLLWDQ